MDSIMVKISRIGFCIFWLAFISVIAKGIQGLVNALQNKIEPALVQMTKMPWSSWESVEDQSDYVNQISTAVLTVCEFLNILD